MSARRGAAAADTVPLLRNRMLRHVLVPLMVTWFCATVVMLAVANDFARQAFDRTLLDNAYAISARLQVAPGDTVRLDISEAELSAALHEQAETVYFSVVDADGVRQAGARLPPLPQPGYFRDYAFERLQHDGLSLRAIVLRHQVGEREYFVVVAHTSRAKRQLVSRLLWLGSLPVLLMLLPLTVWLWDRIERDLQPLAQLHDALWRRDARDLSPVEVCASSREVAQVGKALNELIARLDRNIAAQREFAGNVAHELRTPLAGIRALAEYGLARQDAQTQREQLRQIVVSTERAARLVNQLLDLAMLDEDQVALQIVDVDLAELVRHTVLRHLDKADALGIDLGARGLDESEATGCVVRADTALIVGLLDNLIENALRYGGQTVTVVLCVDGAANRCTVAVEDDGPGIAAAVRADMMQRWTQGDAGEQLGQGAGLGLFLVARYARLLGAPLQLDEAGAGHGLRASVELPRAVAAALPSDAGSVDRA